MADARINAVLKIGDLLFGRKEQLDSLWQEIALNFYPERADFTTKRTQGEEYADHLFTSFPVQARRELGNLMASSLRPRAHKWFSIHVEDEEVDESDAERKFLEFVTDVQRRAMYDPPAGFVRATKQADHDFATFGNGVIKVGLNNEGNGLSFKNYHLRDCAWSENAAGMVDAMHRNWEPSARQLKELFPDKVSKDVRDACQKDPEKPFKCRHVVVPTRNYDYQSPSGKRFPYVSIYVERESETVLEEVGLNYFNYVVPRWQTHPDSQYGTSMATSVVLPDGRTNQVVSRTILEAGEKYVDPPMLATMNAIRGDISLYAGGITTVDMEYDERLGEVLRPISQDKHAMPVGFEIAEALRADIRSGFFLDKIQLPAADTDMTAFEVRRRLEEHIRAASPIFEPIEQDYNDPLCDLIFQILTEAGAFPMEEMPQSLRGQEINFSFRSPLADMAEQQEAETYKEIMQTIWLPAAEIDPAQLANINLTKSTRDAARARGWKAEWFRDEKEVEQRQKELSKAAMLEKGMETIGTAGEAAEAAGKGAQALSPSQQQKVGTT